MANASNTDQIKPTTRPGAGNVLFLAQRQLQTACLQLQQLVDLAPVDQTKSGPYWTSRAPGTERTRWFHAIDALLDYLEAKTDIAYGLSRIPRQGWELSRRITYKVRSEWYETLKAEWDTVWSGIPGLTFEWMYLDVGTGSAQRSEIRPDAIVVSDSPEGECLVMVIGGKKGIYWLQNRAALKAKATASRRKIWNLQASPAELEEAQDVGFAKIAFTRGNVFEQVFESSVIDLRKQQAGKVPSFFGNLSGDDKEQIEFSLSLEAYNEKGLINFGSLDPDLSAAYREFEVQRQEDDILGHIGQPLNSETARFAFDVLQQDVQNMGIRGSAAAPRFAELLEECTQARWNPETSQAFKACCEHRKQALAAEVRIRNKLGQITREQWAMVENVVFAGDQEIATGYEPGVFSLSVKTWSIPGALVLVAESEPGEPDEESVALLYMPGLEGGVCAFATLSKLRSSLVDTLLARTESVFLENLPTTQRTLVNAYLDQCRKEATFVEVNVVPIQGEAFVHGLKAQLSVLQSGPDDEAQRDQWHEKALARLSSPFNAARQAGLNRVEDQILALGAASKLPAAMPEPMRKAVVKLLEEYVAALGASQRLLASKLQDRTTLVDQLIVEKLVADFGVTQAARVTLDFPTYVLLPGPYSLQTTPSKSRVKMSLTELALHNIDHEMSARLDYMNVSVESAVAGDMVLERQLTKRYVVSLCQNLDVARRYSEHLEEVYEQSRATTLARELHREKLEKPFYLLFKAHVMAFQSQYQGLTARGRDLLDRVVDACDPSQSRRSTSGFNLLIPTLGFVTSDWGDPVALDGALFLQDQATGTTLTYLPGSSDSTLFVETPNLQLACTKLAQSCWYSARLRKHLAQLPIDGNVRRYEAYLQEAAIRKYTTYIDSRVPSEPVASVATYMSRLSKARLLYIHDNTSRSNQEVADENQRRLDLELANMKMILGFVPVIGVFVAAYEFVSAVKQAVQAFSAGNWKQGLNYIFEAVLAACEVVMEVLPAVGKAAATVSRLARQSQRQLVKTLAGNTQISSRALVNLNAKPYTGDGIFSDLHVNVSLAGKQASTQPFYKGTYLLEHAGEDLYYIQRKNGLVYPVRRRTDGKLGWELKTDSPFDIRVVQFKNGDWVARPVSGSPYRLSGGGGDQGWGDWLTSFWKGKSRAVPSADVPQPGPSTSQRVTGAMLKGRAEDSGKAIELFRSEDLKFKNNLQQDTFRGSAKKYIDDFEKNIDLFSADNLTLGEVALNTHKEIITSYSEFASIVARRFGKKSGVAESVENLGTQFRGLTATPPVSSATLKQALANAKSSFDSPGAIAIAKNNHKSTAPTGSSSLPGPAPSEEASQLRAAAETFAAEVKKKIDKVANKKTGFDREASEETLTTLISGCEERVKQIKNLKGQDADLISRLESGAKNARRQVTRLKVHHAKRSDPMPDNVNFLLEQNAIEFGSPKRLPHATRKDGTWVVEIPIITVPEQTTPWVLHLHNSGQSLSKTTVKYGTFKLAAEAGEGAGKAKHWNILTTSTLFEKVPTYTFTINP